MMKIAIVEDNLNEQKNLLKCINHYHEEHPDITFENTVFDDGDKFDIHDFSYDVVFLDILMPKKDGMTLAHEIRSTNEKIIIVFVTTVGQYAINGYEVGALDYVLKPINYDSFKLKLDRIIKSYYQKHMMNKTIEVAKKLVSLDNIIYIEVSGHNLYFHSANDQEIVCRGSLKDYEEKLEPAFSRCHSGFLVNLKYVVSIEGMTIHLENGQKLALARNKKKDFVNDFTKFLGSK